ncbi:hypothetical protein [Demequina maris]|uniref:hypothetical protein n=1 Tax=Demequina maris TaxID=1638982 RepID=UPI000A672A93|nr:hypothetical protein [Demequina maris]
MEQNQRGFLSFVIVGAQKAGTTSLHELLQREEWIRLPRRKETHFFSALDRWGRGWPWYVSTFDADSSGYTRGEIDPDYLTARDSAERISSTVGDIPVGVVLRDPIARAHSQYQMTARRGLESRSFAEALEADLGNITLGQRSDDHHDYLWRSLYARSLDEYSSRFSTVSIVRFEDIFADQSSGAAYVRFVESLTGRAPIHPMDVSLRSNPASAPKSARVASILWNREKLKSARRIARLVVPSKEARYSLARRLDSANLTPTTTSGTRTELPPLPGAALSLIIDDLEELGDRYRVDTREWRDHAIRALRSSQRN